MCFVYFRYSQHKNNREINSDDNNNNTNRKMRPIRPSNSSGNLVDNRGLLSDDQDVVRDRKGLVKRTKSFWKFGKNSSDSEILEGMALWRHRDLVDVEEKRLNLNGISERRFDSQQRVRKPSRDKSEDSDKTLNAKQYEDERKEAEPQHHSREKTKPVQAPRRRKMSVSEKVPPRAAEVEYKGDDDEDDFENHFDKTQHIDDQFYDDGDDGLILRTVNRKNILQQYSNDSTGPDSESESEIISDDPYCIVVDDQQKIKRREHITNVAAIGKKLERLSKSTKYDPNQGSNVQNNNKIYNSLEKNNLKNEKKNNETEMHYREKQHSFKTFGREIQNNENGEKETSDNDRYYSSSHNKRSHNESNTLEKRRYYADSGEHNNLVSDRRGRSSYETIDSNHHTNNRRSNSESEKTDKMKYYPERSRREIISDELSDVIESKQFLPRTKLTKTNSNNSKSKYEDDNDLMDYGETLQRRIKSPDHGAVFNEKNPNSGNMYGPWYDLWGLDASVRK